MTQLAKGDADAALGELRRIASSDPGATADLALTGAMLRAKDIDGALKALASLERKQPRNPLVPALRGRIQASGKRLPEARESFERALAIDPACFPATAGLAALDFIAGHPEQSAKRFEAVLSRDPNNLEALQALADLKEASGGSDEEVAAMYGRAVKLNPTQAAPRLALFAHYLKKRDFKHAVTAAQDGVAALPESAPMLEALGRAQMESGDLNQALVSFNRLIALQPDSAQPYLRVADVYAALKSSGQAIQALKRAIAAAPEDLAVQGRLIAPGSARRSCRRGAGACEGRTGEAPARRGRLSLRGRPCRIAEPGGGRGNCFSQRLEERRIERPGAEVSCSTAQQRKAA